ncbi:MAG: glycosyltransferase, partial [Planctomycetaceae bacterium]|nr:glycosyltransferase [Planctomycetaceae bacterium]
HAALCAELDIDPARRPLFGVISRFAWQKGIDVIADIAERIVMAGGAIAALGSGDEYLELRLTELARAWPGAIGARIGYDVGLSHRIEAGADAFLMPSRYEPCGLNQMYSMAYGTVPIVTATGGLRDTVIDATPNALERGEATGFTCAATEPEALWHAIERAIHMFRDRPQAWHQLIRTGMAHDFSWARPAQRYEALYRLAIEHAARG